MQVAQSAVRVLSASSHQWPFNHASCHVQGLSLLQQAELWQRTTVAVMVHGAAMANWMFLPHGAAVVHIIPRPRPGHKHDLSYSCHMVGTG